MPENDDLNAPLAVRLERLKNEVTGAITESEARVLKALMALSERVDALEQAPAPTPAPVPVPVPQPAPVPVPVPQPPPAPVEETAEQIVRRLIAEVWAANPGATPLPAGALAGWIRHFEPLVPQFTEDALRGQMTYIGARDGWFKGTSSPTPPAPPPAGSSSEAQRMVEDMNGNAEIVARSWNYDWQRRATVMMGVTPRLSNTAAWFKKSGFGGDRWWKRCGPWGIITEGVDNDAYDLEFRISDMVLAIKYRGEGDWRYYEDGGIGGAGQKQGGNFFKGNEHIDSREDGDDLIIKPTPGADWHGWRGIYDLAAPDRIECVAVDFKVQMSGPGANRAVFAMSAGADYHLNTNNAHDGVVVPCVAVSRNRRIRPGVVNRVTAVTLRDRGVQDPGGGMSVAEFLANPPRF